MVKTRSKSKKSASKEVASTDPTPLQVHVGPMPQPSGDPSGEPSHSDSLFSRSEPHEDPVPNIPDDHHPQDEDQQARRGRDRRHRHSARRDHQPSPEDTQDAFLALLPQLFRSGAVDSSIIAKAMKKMYASKSPGESCVIECISALELDDDVDSPMIYRFRDPGIFKSRGRSSSPAIAFEGEFLLHLLTVLTRDSDIDDHDQPWVSLTNVASIIAQRIRLLSSVSSGSITLNQAIVHAHARWKYTPEAAWPTSYITKSYVQKQHTRRYSAPKSGKNQGRRNKSAKYPILFTDDLPSDLTELLPGLPSRPPHLDADHLLRDHLRLLRPASSQDEPPSGLEELPPIFLWTPPSYFRGSTHHHASA
eukprot:gnl/Dysnectes_brevis/736_a809_2862.p2 GENE.gnl/Dysnectes_brevis/736_a809_2862~~gnl/Dysnectes_brevis/736_a809_2862.p2  ORF type:complete len:363 (-),score=59.02 gnl/Dysnectes_brevis/736_a809_2862:4537-5625(-)